MAFYALTIFSGAFLLFLVQPLIGKYILPWFGGGPGIWTACMLFFQVMLVGGYAYAHGVSRWLRPRGQVILQLVFLAAAIAALPIVPSDAWKPSPADDPTFRILALLTATIALPYLVLSSTSPLMQHWFAMSFPGRSPYRLFALSNAGSLLALLAYPFYVESHFTRQSQAKLWSVGLVLYALFTAMAALGVWRKAARQGPAEDPSPNLPATPAPGMSRVFLWLLLPACASALLLATTNKLCLDVAVVPFLWVLPLAIYLLSFIVAFDSPRWYARVPFTAALIGALAAFCWALEMGSDWPVWKQATVYGAALFVCCVVCHGELYRLRPVPERLTSFYLLISIGGALGGVFVGLIAPAILKDYYEIHWALLFIAVLFIVAFALGEADGQRTLTWLARLVPVALVIVLDRWLAYLGYTAALNKMYFLLLRWAIWLLLAGFVVSWFLRRRTAQSRTSVILWLSLGTGLLATCLWLNGRQDEPGVTHRSRNFYGVLTVFNYYPDDPESEYHLLQHGRITHGLQFTQPEQAGWATTYFGEDTGVGIAIRSLPSGPRRIGIVGLGTGTLATYGRAGDYIRFYEINPQVEAIARSPFSYIMSCAAKVEVARGDARLVMERDEPQNFDLLILDAFSSDSIPVHLLTREAIMLYQRHLKPGGMLAIHISNHYLDLQPIVRKLADHFGYKCALLDYEENDETWWVYSATWMLLSKDQVALDAPLIQQAASELKPIPKNAQLWTDDFASLFQILVRE